MVRRRKSHFDVTFHFPHDGLPDATYKITVDVTGVEAKKGDLRITATWREIIGGIMLSKMGG